MQYVIIVFIILRIFSYITPEQVPVRYGGFSKGEFGNKDGATQIMVKPTSKETVEFAVTEVSLIPFARMFLLFFRKDIDRTNHVKYC